MASGAAGSRAPAVRTLSPLISWLCFLLCELSSSPSGHQQSRLWGCALSPGERKLLSLTVWQSSQDPPYSYGPDLNFGVQGWGWPTRTWPRKTAVCLLEGGKERRAYCKTGRFSPWAKFPVALFLGKAALFLPFRGRPEAQRGPETVPWTSTGCSRSHREVVLG